MPRLSKIGAAALAAFGWTSGVSGVVVDFLVIAGGGGGGGSISGGGGAGGYRTSAGTSGGGASAESSLIIDTNLTYLVIVGAGGAGGPASVSSDGSDGNNSVFSTVTSIAGGGGKGLVNGGNGGSGGGSRSGSGGTGTSGQGYSGGNGVSAPTGSGGGGAGAVGAVAGAGAGGNGGNGVASSITGSSVTRGGGGGGSGYVTLSYPGGSGGSGGGGAGQSAAIGTAGTANTGSGGGGGGYNATGPINYFGGAGGSGIVIISYAGAQKFGGGVVTSVGGNTIHTFTTSGTLVPVTPLSASYLVVAGGGGGGGGAAGPAGGGAGGLLTGSGLVIDSNSIYTVTVGGGGAGGGNLAIGSSGSNSVFNAITSTGGGYGGAYNGSTALNGGSGGSGGGGGGVGTTNATGGTATSGQGFAGGNGFGNITLSAGGGGGGAGEAGNTDGNGQGGDGLANSISGTSVTYAGGGGGVSDNPQTGYAGGDGGGGAGGVNGGTAGTANLGGGGGAGRNSPYGGAGGSGIVIISYPGATQQMAGGTVTISGGNVIHTFTSTGFLTPIKLVNNSLRFRSSASAYLNRTLTTPTNNLKWTWSGWLKRGTLSVANVPFGAGDGTSNNFGVLQFTTSDTLQFSQINAGSYNVIMVTSAVFRDPAAWYHIQVVYDSANATSTDRVQIYVNGVRQSVTYSTGPFAQNTASKINSAIAHYISKLDYTTVYFDGYQTEVNFIDGQALTPNSFGTFNSYGVWQPITYGGSYGINGFYLPFTNQSVSASYLVVAGGGGGGTDYAGGGGAGGLLNSTTTLSSNLSYTVTVGAGGAAVTQGNSSVFSSFTATGGGKGGGNNGAGASGGSGGSGGGAAGSNAGGAAGAGTSGQGFAGGTSAAVGTAGGGGGGGASAVGSNGISNAGGAGGAGTSSSISGSSVAYAGGGGGGGYTPAGTSAGAGGTGGGGAGAASGGGTAGTANRGGGGGGGAGAGGAGGAGGSGVVIVSYAGAQRFTGGTVTTSGGNTIHTFTSSSTLAGYLAGDYSPNGNNWTQNNISTTLGATYDSMTDVPTLTSATAANFCVMNPINSSATLSGANLNVSCAGFQGVLATFAISSSDSWYWENVINTLPGSNQALVGILGVNQADSVRNLTADGVRVLAQSNGVLIGNATTYQSGLTSWSNGDIIAIAFNASTSTLQFYRNNVAYGSAISVPSNTYAPYCGSTGSTSSISVNFGQRPFAYTPPSGYVALNTFNL